MKTYINIIALLLIVNFAQAQEFKYVKAENGLILREKPNQGANKIATLDYGTQIELLEHTNLKLDIQDSNKIVSGEWLKIRAVDYPGYLEDGYVFSGFLTEERLKRRYTISFDEFSVSFDALDASRTESGLGAQANDTITVALDLNETLDKKTIRIKHHVGYRHIEVLQKHENSITIMNEGPHCDLIKWKHFYSSWFPLKSVSYNNKFKTKSYTEKDWNKFINVDINELKSVVKDYCGEGWSERIKDIKSVNQYPSGVSISKVFFKIIMTDLEGEKIEKIIAFEIPMGC